MGVRIIPGPPCRFCACVTSFDIMQNGMVCLGCLRPQNEGANDVMPVMAYIDRAEVAELKSALLERKAAQEAETRAVFDAEEASRRRNRADIRVLKAREQLEVALMAALRRV